jgi:uroporphyrinogen-III decarboxylase
MHEMTSKQRLLTAIGHQEPDRVPVATRFHLWSVEQYGDYNWLRILKLQEEFGYDPLIEVNFNGPGYIRAPFSGDYRDLDGVSVELHVENKGDFNQVSRVFHTPAGDLTDRIDMPHLRGRFGLSPSPAIREHLVKSIEDVEKIGFILADPVKMTGNNLREMVEMIGERGILEVHPSVGLSAPTMSSVMGMENAMVAFYENRPLFDALLAVFSAYHLRVTKAALEAGAPLMFMSWHDWGVSGGWSPKIWRTAFKPLIHADVELVHSYGALYTYFDNGAIMPLIPDLKDIGVDIVSSLCPQPVGDVDLAKVKQLIGDKVTLNGNVDAIWVVQKGTPEQVREATRETIRIGAPGGGFLLGNSDCFFMDTPRENIQAFFNAAHEFGKYPVLFD